MKEEGKLNEIKTLQNQLSRKIKKEKKVRNLKLKGEKYDIDTWAECDKCKQWRKVGNQVKERRHFKCGDVGKQCHTRERMGKQYIELR